MAGIPVRSLETTEKALFNYFQLNTATITTVNYLNSSERYMWTNICGLIYVATKLIDSSYSVIVRVSVVLKRTVVGD